MTDLALEQLTTTWVPLSDIITVDADAEYLIQNRGPDFCLLFDSTTEPQAGDIDGTLLPNMMQAHYKKGSGDLYVRAYSSVCSIQVTESN